MKMKGIEILNFMGRSNKRVLVHKHMEPITSNETVDIVLTPQFYTFIRETLAIKFAYQAKNIAPSLFDDYLNPAKEYQYHVYKCGEDWCFFAYDVAEIIHFLEERGLRSYLIGKVYFIQELASELNTPVALGAKEALQTIDNVVTVIPQRLLASDRELSPLDLSSSTLQHAITLNQAHDSFISMKQAIILGLLLLLLGGTFLVEGKRIRASIANSLAQEEQLLEENPKLASSLIRNSELQKYKPIDEKERLKRDAVSEVSKMLSKQSHLKSLTLDEKHLLATIETTSERILKEIEKSAKRSGFKIVSKNQDQIVLEKRL